MGSIIARLAQLAAALPVVALATGSVAPASASASAAARVAPIAIVAGEIQYGDVASQVGGPFVHVYSVVSSPNTDPHTYEATPAVAQRIAAAKLLIENGLGYDTFMTTLAAASPNPRRKVIDVQRLLRLPDRTPDPHLWYKPTTMAAVARALATDLAALDPARASAFRANAARFTGSLSPWLHAIAVFRAAHRGTTAATTEPVADYLLQAMGIKNLTPFSFQADVMNGTDPTPQDVSREESLLTAHKVKVFCYNEQVVDALTTSLRNAARTARIPVVGVYETMPTPGYHYQSWMLAEVRAISRAVTAGISTARL